MVKVQFLFLIIQLTISSIFSTPILSSDDQKLNSIVISEIDFTTEHPLIIITDITGDNEPEKSFHELVEKYDEMFISDEQNIKKRNSDDDVHIDNSGKSLLEKIEIQDPDVRKEFEIEISKQNSDAMNIEKEEEAETTENSSQIIETEYDPNYAKKIHENTTTTKLTTHEKENLQVHLVEQLVHHEMEKDDTEFTTIVPDESLTHHELVKDPEIVEVLEHINFESNDELKAHEHTTPSVNVVNMDIDPIEIIPKDRHRLGRTDDDDNNDKFAGFVGIPVEDLEKPGEEVTERDHFFEEDSDKKKEENIVEDIVNAEVDVLREALEIVAIYAKSLKINNETDIQRGVDENGVTLTPKTDEKTESIDEQDFPITTTTTIIDNSSEEEEKEKSIKDKSSEEEKEGEIEDSGSTENLRKIKIPDNDSSSSEEENKDPQRLNLLTEEIFKESTNHEVKKKDHPDGMALPFVAIERKFSDDTSRQFGDDGSIFSDLIDAKTQATITAIYETTEEVLTTISDGIKLSNELRASVNSFRDDSEESSSILDTLREAISSKNSKNPLVVLEVAQNRHLNENHVDARISMMSILTVIALISLIVLIGLFSIIKRRSESFYFV